MVTFRLAQPSLPRYVAKRDRPFFCLQITAPRALLVLAALLSAAIWTRGFAQSPDKRNAGSCCRRDESSCYNCKLNAEFATANATEAFRTARFLCAIGKHDDEMQCYSRTARACCGAVVSLQCCLAEMQCYQERGLIKEADRMRRELVRSGEKIVADNPDAAWIGPVCSLVACCCTRIENPSEEILEKAEKYARVALQKSPDDVSVVWQHAEVCGLVLEKRGQWADAIRIYENVIPQLSQPQKWFFETRLANALIKQAQNMNPNPGSGKGQVAASGAGETSASLINRAERTLENVITEAGAESCFGKQANDVLAEIGDKQSGNTRACCAGGERR